MEVVVLMECMSKYYLIPFQIHRSIIFLPTMYNILAILMLALDSKIPLVTIILITF